MTPIDDSNEFLQGLSTPTQQVDNNFNLQAEESDFEDMPENDNYFETDTDREQESVPLSAITDPDETAEICIDMIDGVQTPIFYLLHRKKLVKKYFKDKEEYKQAAEIYALSDNEIADDYPDNFKELLALKRKYKAMSADYAAKTVEVPLSEEERTRLKAPMRQMVAKSGFNIPPALALCVCMSQIVISRLIDVYWD